MSSNPQFHVKSPGYTGPDPVMKVEAHVPGGTLQVLPQGGHQNNPVITGEDLAVQRLAVGAALPAPDSGWSVEPGGASIQHDLLVGGDVLIGLGLQGTSIIIQDVGDRQFYRLLLKHGAVLWQPVPQN